jgi:hypothetical protein
MSSSEDNKHEDLSDSVDGTSRKPYTVRQSTHIRDHDKVHFVVPEQPIREETRGPKSEETQEPSRQNDHDVPVPPHALAADSKVKADIDTAIDEGEYST